MRIGLNLLYLLPDHVGGTETYAQGLLRGFAQHQSGDREFVLFLNEESRSWEIPSSERFIKIVCPVRATRRRARYFFEQVKLPGLARSLRIDILHSLGYVGPLFPSLPSVVTVHDLNFIAFGKSMPWHRRKALEFFVRRSIKVSDMVITDSNFSRSEIVREFGESNDQIHVVHLASNESIANSIDTMICQRFMKDAGICSPYMVAFCSQSPNKNIPSLVRAFHQIRERLPYQLVLVGHLPQKAYIQKLITELGLSNRVFTTGYLEREQLLFVLSRADFLVFPSTYEGFGLPILEAMSLGVPVACSNIDPLKEVAGDAAILFDPFSVVSISETMVQLGTDSKLRSSLAQKGITNSKRFSWKETARQTLDVYEMVLSNA